MILIKIPPRNGRRFYYKDKIPLKFALSSIPNYLLGNRSDRPRPFHPRRGHSIDLHRMKRLLILPLLVLLAAEASAGLWADFTVTLGTSEEHVFTAELDYETRPIATANFMLLAGHDPDRWQSSAPTALGKYRAILPGVPRPEINITRVLDPDPDSPQLYIPGEYRVVFTAASGFGEIILVGDINTSLTEKDSGGQPRFTVEKEIVNGSEVFVATQHYYPQWYNLFGENDQVLYKEIPISQVIPHRSFAVGPSIKSGDSAPGYFIQDELLNTQSTINVPWGTAFGEAYQLAMDSTGPNTSGGRFFVTSVAEPDFNGVYTRFGKILTDGGGQSVVDNIVRAQVDGGKPPPGYTLKHIKFRYGAAAASFFWPGIVQANSISPPPTNRGIPTEIASTGDSIVLINRLSRLEQVVFQVSNSLSDFNGPLIYGSANLTPLQPGQTNPLIYTTYPNGIEIGKGFFKALSIQHRTWPSVFELKGRRFIFDHSPEPGAPTQDFRLIFNADGTTGTIGIEGVPYTFGYEYDSSEGPFKGVITFRTEMPEQLDIQRLELHFDSTTFVNREIRRYTVHLPEVTLPPPDDPPGLPPIVIVPKLIGAWQEF